MILQIATVETNSARYGALFLMATGMYSSVPAILVSLVQIDPVILTFILTLIRVQVWLTGNSAGHYKRATG
jgi:hypothetical protein